MGELVGVDVGGIMDAAASPASARRGGDPLPKTKQQQHVRPSSPSVAPEDMTTDELEAALANLDQRFERYKRAQW
ncbi:hypothetical protein N9362_00115 [bacterium]|nr:hypothetical protein [bacterium]